MPEPLSLTVAIEVDGSPLDTALEPLLEQVVVDDYLHAPDMFVLTFRDVERSAFGDGKFKIGSKIKVSATAVGGNAPEPLIVAEVTALEAEYTTGGSRAVVRGYDPSHRLHRGRRTDTYQNVTDADIARTVAQRAGLEIGTIESTSPAHEHVSQGNVTDWAFLQARAREAGFEVAVDQGKFCFRRPTHASSAPSGGDFSTTEALSLVFGQELLEFHPRLTSAEQVKEVEVRGWNPAAKEAVVARQPARTEAATIAPGPADLASIFGDPILFAVDRALDSQAAVDSTALALVEQVGSAYADAVGVARGNPRIKAGAAIDIAVVAEAFVGKYSVTSTTHSFDQDGYRTRFVLSGRQDRSLLALASPAVASGAAPINGVVIAIVTNNNDPEKLGRVKVKFPWLSDRYETDWVRLCSLGAGPDSGTIWLPEVQDEVLVAFEFGDFRRPYVVGNLWNGVDEPPKLLDDAFATGKVKRRGFVSRKGHQLVFDDAEDKLRIHLATADEQHEFTLDQTGTKIVVKSNGTIEIESTGDLKIKSMANLDVEATAKLTLKGATVAIQGSGPVEVKGTPITLN